METSSVTVRSVKQTVSSAEWELRVNLAAAYRLVALFGWDDLVFTHISARVPGPERQFLINPYGMMFDEMTASSLVKIDPEGRKVLESPYEINPAGFTIHGCIHAAREDAHCIMHVHSLNGVAVSAQREGVLPISQQSLFVLASLAYHDYEGLALNPDEQPRLVTDLGKKSFLMLRNHGLLTVGSTPAEAFLHMYLFEATCAIQLRAQSGGKELIRIDDAILQRNPRRRRPGHTRPGQRSYLAGPAAASGSTESRLPGLTRRDQPADPGAGCVVLSYIAAESRKQITRINDSPPKSQELCPFVRRWVPMVGACMPWLLGRPRPAPDCELLDYCAQQGDSRRIESQDVS